MALIKAPLHRDVFEDNMVEAKATKFCPRGVLVLLEVEASPRGPHPCHYIANNVNYDQRHTHKNVPVASEDFHKMLLSSRPIV